MMTLFEEMQIASPAVFGKPTVKLAGRIVDRNPQWGERFVAEVDNLIVRVTRDRGQVFADVGPKGEPPKFWHLATLVKRWNPAQALPPDDVQGLGRILESVWPRLQRELTGPSKLVEATYGAPDAP